MKHLNLFETEYEYINSNIEFPNVSLTIDTNTVHMKEEDIVIMTSDSNPVAMEICYNQGWATNPDFMLKSEAEAVTDIGTAFSYGSSSYSYGGQTIGSLTTFHELKYFTSLTFITHSAFAGNISLKEISLPSSLTNLGDNIFDKCSSIEKIYTYAINQPFTSMWTFCCEIGENGVLYYPKGSDYSTWISNGHCYLGYLGWVSQEF